MLPMMRMRILRLVTMEQEVAVMSPKALEALGSVSFQAGQKQHTLFETRIFTFVKWQYGQGIIGIGHLFRPWLSTQKFESKILFRHPDIRPGRAIDKIRFQQAIAISFHNIDNTVRINK